jgi:hypothetical protein
MKPIINNYLYEKAARTNTKYYQSIYIIILPILRKQGSKSSMTAPLLFLKACDEKIIEHP